MKLREAILCQPGIAWRFGILCASASLVLLLAYLHILAGLAYEFHVFAPPLGPGGVVPRTALGMAMRDPCGRPVVHG